MGLGTIFCWVDHVYRQDYLVILLGYIFLKAKENDDYEDENDARGGYGEYGLISMSTLHHLHFITTMCHLCWLEFNFQFRVFLFAEY